MKKQTECSSVLTTVRALLNQLGMGAWFSRPPKPRSGAKNVTRWINRDIEGLHQKLDLLLNNLKILVRKGEIQMHTLDEVLAMVAEQTTVVASTKTLLEQLKAMLEAAGSDPAKVNAVFDAIVANTDTLKAAIVENTPQ